MRKKVQWVDIIAEAFGVCNMELHLSEIYKRVHKLIDEKYPERNIKNVESTVRGTMERFSPDSDCFSSESRFRMTRGKHKGYWMMIK